MLANGKQSAKKVPMASDKIPIVKHRSNLPVREAGPVTDSWPPIFYRKHNGWWCYEIDERINGSGRRSYRQTEAKARERAKWVKEFRAQGVKTEDLDIETLAFVKEAKIKLQTLGYDLREALNGFIRLKQRERDKMTKVDINEAFKKLLEHGKKKGLRGPTLAGYRRIHGVLKKHFAQGFYPVGQLAYDPSIDDGKNKIHELLNKKILGTVHPNTLDNIRIGLSRFFKFCVQEKYIKASENPMIGLEPHRESSEIHTLTVEQTRKLLRTAENVDPDFAGIWALLLFAGLRPTETSRLATDAINFERKTIKIGKSSTKTKRPRYVTINETLEKWLQTYPIKYNNHSYRYRTEKVREAAGFTTSGKNGWLPDITRHTCATMILARNKGDYLLCARELGNSESVLRKHYEAFDRPSEKEVQEYFGILPEPEKSKPTNK